MQLPSLLHRCTPERYWVQNAQAKQNMVSALNQGRQTSKAVRLAIHAPLIPIRTNTNGTTQHIDAPTAATAAPQRAGKEDLEGR